MVGRLGLLECAHIATAETNLYVGKFTHIRWGRFNVFMYGISRNMIR